MGETVQHEIDRWRRRRDGWQLALDATIEAYRHEPFVWGEHDCCLFAARCIDGMLGTDITSRFAGRYSTRAEAKCYVRACGYPGLLAYVEDVCAHNGFAEIPAEEARKGDLIAVPVTPRHLRVILGIRHFGMTILPGEKRLVFEPRELACKAWRID